MDDLPIKTNNSVFSKINNFFKKLFSFKYKKENFVAEKEKIDINSEKKKFLLDIKISEINNDGLEKIQMRDNKNKLLENYAKNPELLKKLTMDELIELENLYDEELKKILNS